MRQGGVFCECVSAPEGGDVFQAECFLPRFSFGDKRTQGDASFITEAAAEKQGGFRTLNLAGRSLWPTLELMALGAKSEVGRAQR